MLWHHREILLLWPAYTMCLYHIDSSKETRVKVQKRRMRDHHTVAADPMQCRSLTEISRFVFTWCWFYCRTKNVRNLDGPQTQSGL